MAVLQQRALITAEELFDSADDGYRCELVRGELVRMNPTGGRHAAVAVRIARLLDEHVEAHDLGVCGTAEPGFILQRTPDVVRAPDVSFVARSRIPEAGIPAAYWPCAPDLAVEVVSPPDRLADVHGKIAEPTSRPARVWSGLSNQPRGSSTSIARSMTCRCWETTAS